MNVEVKRETDMTCPAAMRWADRHRPHAGASYIVQAGKEVVFKNHRQSEPSLRPRYPSVRRPKPHAIVGMADRLRKEGDIENADAMLAMVYDDYHADEL